MTISTGQGMTGLRRHHQGGAAAIEFAFVFPLLLLIVYATIVYGYVFFLQQTINLIAQEAAKAAVAVAPYDPQTGAPITPDYAQAVKNYFVTSKAQGLIAALPASTQADIEEPTVVQNKSQDGTGQVVTVTVRFNNLTTLFPQIGLPGIGPNLPPLPDYLEAKATVRVS